MTKEQEPILIHTASSEQDKEIPSMRDTKPCPDHPDSEPEVQFGMAGGGYGPYHFCPVCGRILGKDQVED